MDGLDDPGWSSNTCTHTKRESSPWWLVDLGGIYGVTHVAIVNRQDCCSRFW